MKDTSKPAFTKAAWKIVTLLSLTGMALAATEPAPQTQLARAYSQLPLRFEPNQGQTASEVRFLAHGPGYNLYLTATEAILALGDLSFQVRLGEPPMMPSLRMTLKGIPLHTSLSELSGIASALDEDGDLPQAEPEDSGSRLAIVLAGEEAPALGNQA